MKYLRLIEANLLRNQRRTLLTTLSVAISILIFSVLMSLPGVADKIVADSAASLRVVCHSRGSLLYSLPEADLRHIRGLPHVDAVSGFKFFLGLYRGPTEQFPDAAVDPDAAEAIFPDWGVTGAVAEAFRAQRTACLPSIVLMRRFGWRVGQDIMLRGTVYPINLTLRIAGVLGDKAPPMLLFRRDYLEEVLHQSGTVNVWMIKVDRSESIPTVIAEIDHTFANSDSGTETESESGMVGSLIGNLRTLLQLATILGGVVVIAIGMVAANTAAMSIRERQGEIAVMRALGFERLPIVACLVGESLAIAIIGGMLGCAAGYVLLRFLAIGTAALGALGLALSMSAGVVAQSIIVAAAIGVGSGLLPALSIVRRDIVNALRFVA